MGAVTVTVRRGAETLDGQVYMTDGEPIAEIPLDLRLPVRYRDYLRKEINVSVLVVFDPPATVKEDRDGA
jgi:hypothetical protein